MSDEPQNTSDDPERPITLRVTVEHEREHAGRIPPDKSGLPSELWSLFYTPEEIAAATQRLARPPHRVWKWHRP